jgi:hypothetical protein
MQGQRFYKAGQWQSRQRDQCLIYKASIQLHGAIVDYDLVFLVGYLLSFLGTALNCVGAI